MCFAAVIYYTWKARNDAMCRGNVRSVDDWVREITLRRKARMRVMWKASTREDRGWYNMLQA